MRKTMLPILFAAAMVASLAFYGFKPGGPTDYTFKSVDDEVALEIERGKGEVLLHLLVRDMGQYDHIVIERSAGNGNYFGKCKYISCADQKTANGVMLEVDKYPFAANKDVYYRIKTVTKDGIERSYPSVLLSGSAQ